MKKLFGAWNAQNVIDRHLRPQTEMKEIAGVGIGAKKEI